MTHQTIEFFPFGSVQHNTDQETLDQLIHARRRYEQQITESEHIVEVGKACETVTGLMAELKKPVDAGLINNPYTTELISTIHHKHGRAREDARRHAQAMPLRTKDYLAVLDNIDEVQKRIAKNNVEIVPTKWHIDEITATLAEMPQISDVIIEDSSGVVSWAYNNLIMYLDENPYCNLEVHDTWGVPLSKIKVTVDLRSGSTHFRGDKEVKHFHDTSVCHPHVMYDYTPCWGSFEYMIIDCLEKADILSLATIIQLFLQQANVEDTAGRGWTRWATGIPENVPSKTIDAMEHTFRVHAVIASVGDSHKLRVTDKWVCVDSSYDTLGDIPDTVKQHLLDEHKVVRFKESDETVLHRRNN